MFSEPADGVIVTDLQFHVRSWSLAAQRMYGWSEHEVLGRHVLDVAPWSEHDHRLSAMNGMGREEARATTDAAGADARDLLRGLQNGEFVVYYQPVVRLLEQRLVAVEALVRWNHPDRGVLDASAFIETAELTGMIVELGAAVLLLVCRQTADWRNQGCDIAVAINISGRELADPNLVRRIAETLAVTGLDPTSLWLEVTETVLVADLDQAAVRLHQLAALGIRLSIDDFGTGWASLLYLRQFPIHALKIDRVFVHGATRSDIDIAIARSVISLGAELGMFVVAEGIETIEQNEALKKLGCTIGQGFLHGRPTPADQVPLHRANSIPRSESPQ